MKKIYYSAFLISIVLFHLTSCTKVDYSQESKSLDNNSTFILKGKVEKGSFSPFSKGSTITLYELDSNLSQTGRTYFASIENNQGDYELKGIGLGGKMFILNSDGFYFNEVMNNISNTQIVLSGLSKLDSIGNINVNLLTHIERRRVQFLMSEKKFSFDLAKKTAISELLKEFEIMGMNISRSELINVLNSDKNILHNISILLQGYRTDAQLTELLTQISNDFYKDGIINDIAIKKDLYNHGFLLDTLSIKNNIETKYNYSSSSFIMLNNYINKNARYKDDEYMPFSYPRFFQGKKNYLERISVDTTNELCATCGTLVFVNKGVPSLELKVKITADSVRYVDNQGVVYNDWNINPSSSQWDYLPSIYGPKCPNDVPCSQIYTSKNSIPELFIAFRSGKYYIDFYEPSSSLVPTFRKILVIK